MCKISGKITVQGYWEMLYAVFLTKIFFSIEVKTLKSRHVLSMSYTFSVITKNTFCQTGLKFGLQMYICYKYFLHIIYMALKHINKLSYFVLFSLDWP